ncbi:nucleoporin NUP42 [Hyla sarda]|uniref:nucleoporin NUP42 n=1 Tax=Hyla sarda TaxID=327740 RepID=UPI0024C4697A|nr:nucleoporin NUP42 [Hyla sarda]
MTVCSFFLQGRCKFGDRCWNEHTRDGRQPGQNRYQPQSSSWNASGQRHGQPPTISKNLTWTRENDRGSYGSGSGDNRSRTSKPTAPSGFFSSQNRFSGLANQEHAKDSGQDKEDSLLADIQNDMETWESSGQWLLSVYCVLKEQRHLSGFADISPEELRLECYTALKEGKFQNYVNSVQQLVNQWKQRVRDVMNMNPSSNAALLNQLSKPPTVAAPSAFGGQQSGSFGSLQQTSFGTSSMSSDKPVAASSFSFKPESHTAAPNAGASSSFPSSAPMFSSQPSFGFGNKGPVSAASFSFAPTTTPGDAASTAPSMAASGPASAVSSGFGRMMAGGFGSSVGAAPGFGGPPSAAGFGGFSSSTKTSGFGAVPTGAISVSTPGTSLFGQGVTGSSVSSAVGTSAADSVLSTALFTPRSELSQEDLLQFESRTFTLGKVPLVSPPADLLTIK